jgi:hypothetical protein
MYFSKYSPFISIVNQVQSFPLRFEFPYIYLEAEEVHLKSEMLTVVTTNTLNSQFGARCSLDSRFLVTTLYDVTTQKTVV